MGQRHEMADHYGYQLSEVPVVEREKINGYHLVAIQDHPAVAFILDAHDYSLPPASLLHQDMGTRLELIHRDLCGLPTTVAPDMKYVAQNSLAVAFAYMNQIAKDTGIPEATKLYVRTRVPGGTTSQNLESRGLLVYDIDSDHPSYFHVGGDLNGREVGNLDVWKASLPPNTQFMIHLENKRAQLKSLHVKIKQKPKGGYEAFFGTRVMHARQLGRTGKWVKIDDINDLSSEIERIAEGRDYVTTQYPVSDPDIQRISALESIDESMSENDRRIALWLGTDRVQVENMNRMFWFDSHPSSSRDDAYKIARLVLPFMDKLLSMHSLAQHIFFPTVVSEFRCHMDPIPSVHMMDINSDAPKSRDR